MQVLWVKGRGQQAKWGCEDSPRILESQDEDGGSVGQVTEAAEQHLLHRWEFTQHLMVGGGATGVRSCASVRRDHGFPSYGITGRHPS